MQTLLLPPQAMVVLADPALDEIPLLLPPAQYSPDTAIPAIDLSLPGAAKSIVKACQDLGFFKLVNHRIPLQLMQRLEDEALRFFSLPHADKDAAGPANPFGYGSRSVGQNGDVGWIEYLLFLVTSDPSSPASLPFLHDDSTSSFRSALGEYLSAVQKLAADVLGLMAQGLRMKQRDALSKLVMDEQSDGIFRLNHYPPCPRLEGVNGSLTGFGEHTDPQIISILRSNNRGLQISLKDGSWVAVPSDHESFFINVGDALEVLTNGRFRSVKHRVLTDGLTSRLSMIYFFGPPPPQRIAPLAQLLEEGEESRYMDFTWEEYKKAAYGTRLGDNRLSQFEKQEEDDGETFSSSSSFL